jgi:ElaB/YqjD/DUF883 family membrane-anchored ribosome-binding protein
VDDQPQVIRSQMDQTRSDLTEKLESLEHRVSEGMQTTGAAVSDTMTSVRDAAQSVREALDFRLQVHRHPWIAIGGSVALGYLAARLLEGPAQRPATSVAPRELPPSLSRPATEGDRSHSSSRDHGGQLRGVALGLLMSVMHHLAARGLPLVLDYLLSQRRAPAPPQPMIAPTPATLPLSSKTTPGVCRPQVRQVV